jgi:hypothetical protein
MKIPKIKRPDFTDSNQEGVAIFAENVSVKCVGGQYKAVANEVANVSSLSSTFRGALTDASGGDKAKGIIAKTIFAQLVTALKTLATMLELQPEASELYYVEAGFNVVEEKKVSYNRTQIVTPLILKSMSTGIKGQLRMELDEIKESGFRKFSLEFSTDQGATWQNGKYTGRRKFVYSDLPSTSDLMVRARAIGTHDRVSPWSTVVTAAVL